MELFYTDELGKGHDEDLTQQFTVHGVDTPNLGPTPPAQSVER